MPGPAGATRFHPFMGNPRLLPDPDGIVVVVGVLEVHTDGLRTLQRLVEGNSHVLGRQSRTRRETAHFCRNDVWRQVRGPGWDKSGDTVCGVYWM
jgi:hypothetical protein